MALYFKTIGLESGYYWLVAVIFAVGFVAACLLPDERRGTRLSDD